jgi:hypothetical protein
VQKFFFLFLDDTKCHKSFGMVQNYLGKKLRNGLKKLTGNNLALDSSSLANHAG